MLVLNTHTEQLLKTMGAVHTLHSLLQVDYAHTQLVSMRMSDMLRDNSSSVDSLAMGIITPYLVPLSLVQDILTAATRDSVTPLQAHLAYTLGSAVSIHVDPEATELALIINLPIVTPENINILDLFVLSVLLDVLMMKSLFNNPECKVSFKHWN